MWKQQNQLYWGIVLSILCFGGFYDWTAVLLGTAVCVMGIFRIIKERKVLITKDKGIWLILLQEICLLTAMFTAVDRGMNFVGILRFLPVIAWLFLSMQYSGEQRKMALQAVPHMGCITVLAGVLALIIPGAEEWLWSAQRLGGFFQYSNTCAIFFLIGMMLLNREPVKYAKIQWTILFWGILITGSRTVMLLMAAVLVCDLCSKNIDKGQKYLILSNVGIGILAAVVMVLFTGSYQNIARIATIFTSNSTFYGRLLYWKDALGLIVKHPLGLGWRGYHYIQPAVQTGVYSTMYVHNDLLQAFLDGGWAAGAAMAALIIWQVRTSSYRFLLAVLFVHCLADIDLQYPAIWFTAILMFDFGKDFQSLKREKRLETALCLGAAAILCAYFILPFGAEFLGRYKEAVYLYSGYTQAKEELLGATGNAGEAVRLADEILEQNQYSAVAYDAKALAAYMEEDIANFVQYKERVLDIERYDISQYQDYAYLLKRFEMYAAEMGDEATRFYCAERYSGIQKRLDQVKSETSMLAWKLRDQPVFVLEE